MTKLRNISPDDLVVPIDNRWVRVGRGAEVTVPDDDTVYWQTGDQGETAIWEVVVATAPATTKKEK